MKSRFTALQWHYLTTTKSSWKTGVSLAQGKLLLAVTYNVQR